MTRAASRLSTRHRRRVGPLATALAWSLGLALGLAVQPGIASDAPAADSVAIFTIQGRGNTSPMAGQTATTQGVVTKVTNNGFFMQDPKGDGDPLTSDGIFVATGSARYAAAAVGHLVRVTGTVVEFNTGTATNADTAAHTVTQLSAVTGVTWLEAGLNIAPTPVALPEAVNDDLERHEGMLVTIAGPLTVQQNHFLGRYGQLTLASGGRLEAPTNRHRPGSAAARAMADENARRRIVLDDGTSVQNPNPTPYASPGGLPRAGDRVDGINGVIDYGLSTNDPNGPGDYRIHPTQPPVFAVANPRPARPPSVGGSVRLASFNVLNFFTTFADGITVDGDTGQGCAQGGAVAANHCRGAANLAEFNRQRAKIVEALAVLDADAVGLMEMHNNGNTAVNHLVAALNARAGAGAYASVAVPPATGSDAIRVAMIYQPARLSPQGPPRSDADAVHHRPPLAQAFATPGGDRFLMVVNHFKSKGSCPINGDAEYVGNHHNGDGQACWNARRLAQARRLATWVAGLTSDGAPADVVLMGDFNAYAREDPIEHLTGLGYVDQIARFDPQGYSFVYDGAMGRLDHALTSASLSARVSGAADWHINADEASILEYGLRFRQPACAACAPDRYAPDPYRSSDHDPVLLGLNLPGAAAPRVNPGLAGTTAARR